MSNIIDRLEESLGKKTIVILETFPFFMVGTLQQAADDHIIVKPNFGVPVELRDIPFTIVLENIVAIFPEDEQNQIPTPAKFGMTNNQNYGNG
ncbi:hypothetical protein U472_07635 [Orenia metallireducens]|jgi:hypothetical protein|uniref:Uncharacterized protein n=1 Tax=Orenia metallireducens TaxID=1413210 RepID=A0A1C0AAN2_9FIRM|nr:hypothetical protein [Orenia metallireducens]OCL27323.1 hypothetical protein U472_07635 [Orenia metallireducens]